MRSMGLILLVAASSFVFSQEDSLFSLPDTPEIVEINTPPDGTFGESISLIGIKRTPCFGGCPVYEMVLRNDGRVAYRGERFIEEEGFFNGHLNTQTYTRLAEFIMTNDLKNLKDEYRISATDLPGIYVVFIQGGEKKVIYDYGNVGPTVLWVLQQLIDSVFSEVVWDE